MRDMRCEFLGLRNETIGQKAANRFGEPVFPSGVCMQCSSRAGFAIFVGLMWAWLVYDLSLTELARSQPTELPSSSRIWSQPMTR